MTYLSKYTTISIEKRMIYGYLAKRNKGKMKYFSKKWLILISSKSLYKEYQDDILLAEEDLYILLKKNL